MGFKEYKRKSISEMRPVTETDIKHFKQYKHIDTSSNEDPHPMTPHSTVSISDEDLKAGSPKLGDMIARNPKNHKDQWLVAEQYFKDNFDPI